MLKIGLFTLLLPLLFTGCEVASYSILLTNATETKTVSYTYNGISSTLGSQETRFYNVGAWTQPPTNVVDQNGIASISVVTNEGTGDHTFVYSRIIILEVLNTLPMCVTIQADNFIDDKGSMQLNVGTGETAGPAIIYTENPRFTVTTGFQVNFDINTTVLEDVLDNTDRPQRKMFVTIR